MVQLFLCEPLWKGDVDEESVTRQASLLKELQSTIWSLLTSSGGRSEARLWLCDSLSQITAIPSHHQHELFMKILRCKPLRRAPLVQVLHMIFEKQPRKAGYILAKKSHLLEDFFRDNPRRIVHWFSNFSGSSNLGHTKGAKALSQFAFVNRDICWEELEWKGKHGQSPAMVATKPHYFLDLDVPQTVENFLEHVPEFWSSNEFADSLEGGDILSIDKQYFLDFFVGLMAKEDSKEVWKLVNEFLKEEPFDSLCRRLLIILEERQFSYFLEALGEFLNPRSESVNFDKSWHWLELILSKCCETVSIEELLLLNAVISQGRKLLRLVNEADNEKQKVKIENIVAQISTCSTHPCWLAQSIKENSEATTVDRVKLLGVQSWSLHYRLVDECQSPDIWESVFHYNGIKFRGANKYELLNCDSFFEEWDSDLDERASTKVKKKKKGSRKRRRKCSDADDRYGDYLDIDATDKEISLKCGAGTWLLSTDGYTTSWTNVDLPEHLSRHCFSTWMKWIFTR